MHRNCTCNHNPTFNMHFIVVPQLLCLLIIILTFGILFLFLYLDIMSENWDDDGGGEAWAPSNSQSNDDGWQGVDSFQGRTRGGRGGRRNGYDGGGGSRTFYNRSGDQSRRDGNRNDQRSSNERSQGWGRDVGSSDSVTMNVESQYLGRIIGRGGSKINELQDESGARIKVR